MNRISKEALELIEKKITEDAKRLASELEQEMVVNGRREVDKKIVEGGLHKDKIEMDEDVL